EHRRHVPRLHRCVRRAVDGDLLRVTWKRGSLAATDVGMAPTLTCCVRVGRCRSGISPRNPGVCTEPAETAATQPVRVNTARPYPLCTLLLKGPPADSSPSF